MRKQIITFLLIIMFIIINFLSLRGYYDLFYGNKLYENKDFLGALNYFEKNKDYIGLYNLGNTNYRLGEQEKEDNKKIEYWEKSVNFYKNSLKLKYDPRTEYNYNFVLDKLKKLKDKLEEDKKKQEQKNNRNKENQKSGEEKNQDKKQNGDNKKDGNSKEGKEGENGKQFDKNGENGEKKGGTQDSPLQDNKGKSEPQLSKEAKEQIKAYEEKLKQDQKINAGDFGKVYREQTNPFDNFDEFFNNPLFDNRILDRNEKKDW